ncbi:phosphatidylglycerol lysyltransferase [Paraburkholderia sp. GAS334]
MGSIGSNNVSARTDTVHQGRPSFSERFSRAFGASTIQRLKSLPLRRIAVPALALVVCTIVLLVIQHLSKTIDYHSVVRSLRHLSPQALITSLVATAASYVVLVARDAVGLRSLGACVSRPVLWIGATVASALGNATGFGALTGGAVRIRIYGAEGIKPAQVGRLTLFTSVTLGLSLVLLSGLGMLYAAPSMSRMTHLSPTLLVCTGLAIVALFALLIGACRPVARQIQIGPLKLDVPARRDLVAQLALAAADVAAASIALWALLPQTDIGFAHFIAIFSMAMLLGMIGHTPGGLGVFEASMVFALGGTMPTPAMVAALLAYRVIYFGVPLLLSSALLAGFEGQALKARFASRNSQHITQLAPLFLSVITFAVGGMLVISGATPAFGRRLAMLQTVLPLWVLEGSQLLASLLGVLLLFVARGLLRRLDAAWWLTMLLALASLALSLTKGLAFVEAGVLSVLIILLATTRQRFNRSSSLFSERFTATWLVSVGIVMIVASWVLFFAFRDVPYSRDLWWDFAFDERAPRALRATLGACLFATVIAFWQLLRPAAGRFVMPPAVDLADAAKIVRAQERSDAGLALMGDKSFLFSKSREAFLMYAKHGRTWAALHDPVGPREEWVELIGEFMALAHAHGGRAAFYQVRADALPLYLDAGLSLMKLGEEARIVLSDFELAGAHRTHLRYALKRGERDGLTAEMYEPPHVPGLLPTLRGISDAWLDSRSAKEKSFSVAAFTDDYLAAQSVMLVRQQGTPVAFVTFMTTDLNLDATVGVMRHAPDASPYAMEYLFTKLALHLKQENFRSLSLGMAPLSGMNPTPLASPWHRLAGLMWRFGCRFYNFRGLRGFKSKFQPTWEPRYLAASGSVGVVLTLADLSLLAEGWRS